MSPELEVVINNMVNDDVIAVVKTDSLIATYGSCLVGSSTGIRNSHMISQRMSVREAVKTMRFKMGNNDPTLTDGMHPTSFDTVIEATKEVGSYSLQKQDGEIQPEFLTPSPTLVDCLLLGKVCLPSSRHRH